MSARVLVRCFSHRFDSFPIADRYSGPNELAVVMQILGRVKFVSRLFPMCMKPMRTKHIISVREFFLVRCCHDASYIMLVMYIFLNS